jgi:hypothetical protein
MGELSRVRGGQDAAAEALREAGIPGIRYLDQMSRGTTNVGAEVEEARAALAALPSRTDLKPEAVVAARSHYENVIRQGEEMVSKQTRNIVMFPGTEDKIRIDSINGEPVRGGLAQ